MRTIFRVPCACAMRSCACAMKGPCGLQTCAWPMRGLRTRGLRFGSATCRREWFGRCAMRPVRCGSWRGPRCGSRRSSSCGASGRCRHPAPGRVRAAHCARLRWPRRGASYHAPSRLGRSRCGASHVGRSRCVRSCRGASRCSRNPCGYRGASPSPCLLPAVACVTGAFGKPIVVPVPSERCHRICKTAACASCEVYAAVMRRARRETPPRTRSACVSARTYR